MLPEELLKRVRQIEISTRKRVDDMMSGQYKSHFKGSGVQFSEHRQYVPGDDVRHIDWKVSARSRDPLVKKYEEERELTVLIVVDGSGSQAFGSGPKLKTEVSAEIAGMLAYAATYSGDKVGMLIFDGEVRKIVPPRKGRSHVLRMIRDLLTFEPKAPGTALAGALESADRLLKHGGVVFVVSDWLASDYALPLKRLARRNDVVAIQVRDERETDMPDIGNILMVDPETGEERFVDTSSYLFKKWLGEFKAQDQAGLDSALKGGRIERLSVVTGGDYADAVVKFFRARSRRKR